MGRSGETNHSRGFWKPIFLAVALLCTLPLVAQKGQETSPPKYDVRTETKMKGTLEEVKLPPKGSEKEIAHLLVKTGTDTVDVYLCPKSFLDDMGVSFSKGDEIALAGSKVKQGGAELILAREVVKGTDTLVLRDEKGNPVYDERLGVRWHGTRNKCIYPPIIVSGLRSAVFDTPRGGKPRLSEAHSFVRPPSASKPPATAIPWTYP